MGYGSEKLLLEFLEKKTGQDVAKINFCYVLLFKN